MSEVYGVKETIANAVDTFSLDREGFPVLVPLGLEPLDAELGGLGPGSCGILAAATGVGKSSAMLAAMLGSSVKVGSISVEDGPDVVGTRLLSAITGIDSLRIRRKALSKEELKLIGKAAKSNQLNHMYFTYPIAGKISRVEEDIAALCRVGCKMIWLDYLQEVQGTKEDRRNEVSEVLRRAHGAAAEGGAAIMAISQFRRLGDTEKVPQIYHLKESGDLENKARVIILAHRVKDPNNQDRVRFRLGKSTYGGEHITFDMVRDPSGTLRKATFHEDFEDF